MEILIVGLALGLLALVGLVLKFSGEESKWQKISEDSKSKKLSDLEAEISHRDKDLKKTMEERQKLEDEFFKVKDDADILKKENLEMAQKIKLLERTKEEFSESKAEIKQRDMLIEQETLACQKLQGELALKDQEALKLAKELEVLRGELKTKTEMFDGLKGQFSELEGELQRAREEMAKSKFKEPGLPEKKAEQKEGPVPVVKKEAAPVQALGEEKKKEDEVSIKPSEEKEKEETPKEKPEVKSSEQDVLKKPAQLGDVLVPKKAVPSEPVLKAGESKEIPGFPKKTETKIDIKQGVPKDTDFLKTSSDASKQGDEEVFLGGMPQNFKLTNVNRPRPEDSETPKPQVLKTEPVEPEALKDESPKAEPLKQELLKVETPQAELPKVESPKPQTPKAEAAKIEPPKTEMPKAEPVKVEPSQVEPLKPQAPKGELPQAGSPKPEPVKKEPLKQEPSKKEVVEKKPQEKDKSKSKRETLIDGFHPRPSHEEPPA
jgi:hypothetical protein